jgi:hypothetical protein
VSGVHACRIDDLPYWIGAELWEVELEGARQGHRKLVATRGRLVRRVEGWDGRAQREFAGACARRVRGRADEATGERAEQLRAYASDAAANAERGEVALLGFIAARAAEVDAGTAGYAAERAAQASWLAAELRLEEA